MEIEGSFVCPYCLQVNTILVDLSAGREQEFIEDCQVCCRPVLLSVVLDPEYRSADVTASTP
jgi:predicted DsbA family dithiol-disulfide isomerase